MNCIVCGIEFEGRKDAKYCSPKCRKDAFQKRSLGTDNGTDNIKLSKPVGTDNFRFTVLAKPDVVREAKYWYDVPLGAVPMLEEGWPPQPDYMNGRQYFLWWKNNFKTDDKDRPVIHNPLPSTEGANYVMAGEGSKRWGA